LDSPSEHLHDDWLTEEELEIKCRRQNHDERIREATEQRYGASSVLHPGLVTGQTEVPSGTLAPNGHPEYPSSVGSTPRVSNRFTPTPETDGLVTPTVGATTPSGEVELTRSTCSTAGKFQTDRYADVFLARVEDYGYQSNYSHMAYLSELQTDWDEGTVNISYPIVYAAKNTRYADNPSFCEAMHGDHQEQ
jgi:hypothetical protein